MTRDEAIALAKQHAAARPQPAPPEVVEGEPAPPVVDAPLVPDDWVVDAILAAAIAAQNKRVPSEADLKQALLTRATVAAGNGSVSVGDVAGLVDAYVRVRDGGK